MTNRQRDREGKGRRKSDEEDEGQTLKNTIEVTRQPFFKNKTCITKRSNIQKIEVGGGRGSVSRSIPKKALDGLERDGRRPEERERMIVLMASTCLQNDCQKQAMEMAMAMAMASHTHRHGHGETKMEMESWSCSWSFG